MNSQKNGSYSGKEPWIVGFFLLIISIFFFYSHLFEFPTQHYAETEHPLIMRIGMALSGLAGLTAFYLMVRKTGAVASIAALSTMFIYSSPVFSFHLNGFNPGITALGFSFISLLFYVKYLKQGALKHYMLSMAALTIAALIRPPFLMYFLAVVLIQSVSRKNNLHYWREIKLAALYLIVFGAFWLFYHQLESKSGSIFSAHLMPAKSIGERAALLATAWKSWKLTYFTGYHYLVLLVSLIIIWAQRKKGFDAVLRKLLLLSAVGISASFIYSFAAAAQFAAYDYYFLNSFFLPLSLLMATGLSHIVPEQKLQAIILWIIAVTASALMLGASLKVQQKRISAREKAASGLGSKQQLPLQKHGFNLFDEQNLSNLSSKNRLSFSEEKAGSGAQCRFYALFEEYTNSTSTKMYL